MAFDVKERKNMQEMLTCKSPSSSGEDCWNWFNSVLMAAVSVELFSV